MNTRVEIEMLDSSWLIFCFVLIARTAPAILAWGMQKADFPRTGKEVELTVK